jgi:hypothetical protein
VSDPPARDLVLHAGRSHPVGATIWASELFGGTTYVYDEYLNPTGSFPSPTGLATTSGIAYDPSAGTLWYIDGDAAELVESDLAGVPTGNVISCLPSSGGLVSGLSYNPDGDGGAGTFIYIDIVGDDVFEITRSSAVVRQIPQSCLDADGSSGVFGNGTAFSCGFIEVLAGSVDVAAVDRAVLIDSSTGADLGLTTELLVTTGDTFLNGFVRHPADPNGLMYVIGNATNTIFTVDPADCPVDCDNNGILDHIQTAPENLPADAVAQDDCGDAMLVGPGITYYGDTFGATNDGYEFCGLYFGVHDVWYRVRTKATGVAFVEMNGPPEMWVCSIFTGCPGTAINMVACNDPNPNGVTWWAERGQDYYVRIAAQGGITADYQFRFVGADPWLNLDDFDGNGVPDECECLYDVDGDNDVDEDDFAAVLAALGPCPPGPCPADVDMDGDVDEYDAQIVWLAIGLACP